MNTRVITIDLVVIARNSEPELWNIYGDPEYLARLHTFFDGLWYMDSSSSDNSVAVMQGAGFSCVQVGPEGRLSAAASRAVAASQSSADLIFFLDGDMALDEAALLPERLQIFLDARARDPRLCGFTGRTLDVYPGGGTRWRTPHTDAEGDALSFGGFVALERQALLATGNWNGNVLANEELELHARLRREERRVHYLPAFSVRHYTVVTSPWHELAAAYLPLRPDRYGAFGMAVRAAQEAGSLLSLFRLMPEPFALMAALLAALAVLAVIGWTSTVGWVVALLAVLAHAVWVAHRRGPKFIVVVPALLVSLPWGFLRYRRLPVRWRRLDASNLAEGAKFHAH